MISAAWGGAMDTIFPKGLVRPSIRIISPISFACSVFPQIGFLIGVGSLNTSRAVFSPSAIALISLVMITSFGRSLSASFVRFLISMMVGTAHA